MTSATNRQVVERYVKALTDRDLNLQAEVCTTDLVVDYPQSGERIRGWANVRAVHENYPGGLPQDLDGKVIGSEDKWVVGPSFNVLRIEGTGDIYTVIGSAHTPTGRPGRWCLSLSCARARSRRPLRFTGPLSTRRRGGRTGWSALPSLTTALLEVGLAD